MKNKNGKKTSFYQSAKLLNLLLLLFFIVLLSKQLYFTRFVNLGEKAKGKLSFNTFQNTFLFVTTYFHITSPKHSTNEYTQWIKQFCKVFFGELYVYTHSDTAQLFTTFNRSNIHIRTKYSTPWDISCMRNKKEIYDKQFKIDPEKWLHINTSLYAVWNSKICYLKEISDEFPMSYVFWIDSGSLRDKIFYNIKFPNYTRLYNLLLKSENKKMIQGYVDKNYIEGGFFGGNYIAIHDYYNLFWTAHDFLLNKGHFIGKDQNIYNYLFRSNKPLLLIPLNKSNRKCNQWFAFYSFLTDPNMCFISKYQNLIESSRFHFRTADALANYFRYNYHYFIFR